MSQVDRTPSVSDDSSDKKVISDVSEDSLDGKCSNLRSILNIILTAIGNTD